MKNKLRMNGKNKIYATLNIIHKSIKKLQKKKLEKLNKICERNIWKQKTKRE